METVTQTVTETPVVPEQVPVPAAAAVVVAAPVPVPVQSPPAVKAPERPITDGRDELRRLADEVAQKGTRKLLWDYLRLRSRVVGK